MKKLTFRAPEAPNADRVMRALYHATILWGIFVSGLLGISYICML